MNDNCSGYIKSILLYALCKITFLIAYANDTTMAKKGDNSNVTLVMSVRVTPGILRFMDQDIEENEIHRSRADWVQTALDHYMKERIEDMKKIRDLLGGGGPN